MIEIGSENNNVELREGCFQTETENEMFDSSDDDFDENKIEDNEEKKISMHLKWRWSQLIYLMIEFMQSIPSKKIASILMEEN